MKTAHCTFWVLLIYSLKIEPGDVVFRNINLDDPRFDQQKDQPMNLAKEFLSSGAISKKMKWKAWRDREDARKARIKELERERETQRQYRNIKKAKKAARNSKKDIFRSSPLEKTKRKYQVLYCYF